MKSIKVYDDILNSAFMLAGIPRSGTTILGKILAAFKNVEYSYEPPLADPVDQLLEQGGVDSETVLRLFQVYLCQDVMLNHLQGRNVNMRPADGSSIFQYKEYAEVIERWNSTSGVKDAVEALYQNKHRLFFKVTHCFNLSQQLLACFDGFRVIEIRRNLINVASSLADKRWFSKLEVSDPRSVTSSRMTEDGLPYFLPKDTRDGWQRLPEPDAAAAVAIALSETALRRCSESPPERYHVVRYEDLLAQPVKTVQELVNFCGLEYTPIAQRRISEVEERPRHREVQGFFESLQPDTRESLMAANQAWGYG